MEIKCDKGWHDGSCCCNCLHQKRLMCHPWNGNQNINGILDPPIKFGKGAISQQCGWVCAVQFEDDSNNDQFIFFDFEHGFCELHKSKL
jgi:hypothetical protein